MKKFISALTLLFTLTVSANAMSYEQAREQALFLTDKMAYELNLSEAQYEAAYEINLDYLMSIATQDDLFGVYWRQRNLDLSYILFDWQYNAYCSALYFYRPLYWHGGYWRFRIYARYPHRDYFYFGCPHFVTVYRGGHSWHHNGGRSWYRANIHRPRPANDHFGMRDSFKRGDYGKGHTGVFGNRKNGSTPIVTSRPNNSNGSFGNRKANNDLKKDLNSINASRFGGARSNGSNGSTTSPRNTFTPKNKVTSRGNNSENGTTMSNSGRFGSSSGTNRNLINNIRDNSEKNSSSSSSFGSSSRRSTSTGSSSIGSSSRRSTSTGSSSIGSSSRRSTSTGSSSIGSRRISTSVPKSSFGGGSSSRSRSSMSGGSSRSSFSSPKSSSGSSRSSSAGRSGGGSFGGRR